jgi:hypothetical protein
METKIRVQGGLQSLLDELGRSKSHYVVIKKDKTIALLHHRNKWYVSVSPKRIKILTDDDILILRKSEMYLNNEKIRLICNTVECYDREQLISMIISAILKYYDIPAWLTQWK